MKKQLLIGAMLLLSVTTGFCQAISTTRQLPIDGFYTNPVVSPDGNFVLLTSEHYHGVFLLNNKTYELTEITHTEGSGYGYSWDKNSSTFYFKQKAEGDYNTNAKVYSYDIISRKINALENIHNTYLPSFSGYNKKEKTNVIVYTNLTTLKIEAIDLATSEKWIVTKEEGQFYNAIMSNDGKKVAVHNGADVYIYDLKGDGTGTKIGTGLVTSWSPDNRYLIGFLDESKDGHTVSNSDLYLFDTLNPKQIKITTTENVFEMFPYFDGSDKIIYADDRSGHLFISNIKL